MIINDDLTKSVATANPTSTVANVLGGGGSGFDQLIRLLEAINGLLNNPVIVSRFGKQQPVTVGNPQIAPPQPAPQSEKEQRPQETSQQDVIMTFLKSPNAKEQIKKFISDIMGITGDVPLSKLIELIDKIPFDSISKLGGLGDRLKQ